MVGHFHLICHLSSCILSNLGSSLVMLARTMSGITELSVDSRVLNQARARSSYSYIYCFDVLHGPWFVMTRNISARKVRMDDATIMILQLWLWSGGSSIGSQSSNCFSRCNSVQQVYNFTVLKVIWKKCPIGY